MRKQLILIILALLNLPILAWSELRTISDSLLVWPLDPVVITGTRIESHRSELPLSISVIPSKIIQEQNHVPLLDLIAENIPGLFVSRRTNLGYGVGSGAGGQISIRGLGSFPNTQVLVLIDGRPDIMGLFGHPLGDAYFLHDVERIEVIRGPASLIYGTNAAGGAINIITRHQREPGFHFTLPLHYGSYDTKQTFLQHGYQGQNWGYSISGGYRASDGFRNDGNDSYESESVNLEMHARLHPALKLTANSYISNLHLNDPGQINQPYQDHWYELRRRGADISLQHRTHRFQSELKIHHNSGVHEIYDGYRSQDQSTGFSLTETVIPNLGTRILLGVDYRYSGGKALIDKTWKEHYISENSIMAHLHQKLFGCFSLDGGVRYNQHSVVGSILIPAAGLTLHLPYQINIKIQYAQGFRNPSINELYLFLPSTTDLQPEQTANLELVVEKQYAGFLNTSLSLYQIKASNLIQKFGMPPLYHNTGEVIIHGLELEGRVLLPPQWVFQYGVSLMQTSTILAAAPSEKADVSVRYSPYTKFNITLQGQWVNNLFSLENPYSYGPVTYKRLDSYLLLNLRFNYQVGQHLQTYLSFENLTSVNYEVMYGFPMPGRSFTAGLSIYN